MGGGLVANQKQAGSGCGGSALHRGPRIGSGGTGGIDLALPVKASL